MAGERFRGGFAALGDDQSPVLYVALGAVVAMLIASICPWLALEGASGVTVNGTGVEGAGTLLGLAALAAVPLIFYALRGDRGMLALSAVAGGLGVVLAISDATKFDVFDPTWGLWLFLIASAVVFGTSVWLFQTHARR
jgi:hypothetical protein